jgi:hypothetical protein
MASIDRFCWLQLDQRWTRRHGLVLYCDLDLHNHRNLISCGNGQHVPNFRGSISLYLYFMGTNTV